MRYNTQHRPENFKAFSLLFSLTAETNGPPKKGTPMASPIKLSIPYSRSVRREVNARWLMQGTGGADNMLHDSSGRSPRAPTASFKTLESVRVCSLIGCLLDASTQVWVWESRVWERHLYGSHRPSRAILMSNGAASVCLQKIRDLQWNSRLLLSNAEEWGFALRNATWAFWKKSSHTFTISAFGDCSAVMISHHFRCSHSLVGGFSPFETY